MKDKYDEAVEYLRQNPAEIQEAWTQTWEHKAGCLFRPVAKSHAPEGHCWPKRSIDAERCGCLTTIRGQTGGGFGYAIVAETDELTQAIIADGRIPKSVDEITVDNLEVFAEWNRRIDKELGRE